MILNYLLPFKYLLQIDLNVPFIIDKGLVAVLGQDVLLLVGPWVRAARLV